MKKRIGIFGATGMVGQELLQVLKQRDFPLDSLSLYASSKSAGKKHQTPFGEYTLQDANEADYSELDIAFFAIGGGWPSANAPKAVKEQCVVIDNSSTFRYDDNVPLLIPEINPQALGDSMLIANPNCTTAVASIPLWVIHQQFELQKVIISSYQAVSGAGINGLRELEQATTQSLEGKQPSHEIFQHPIAFNVIPHIDDFKDNLYTKEEMKVVWETRKIFGLPDLAISSTCVRVPTKRAHAESIVVETKKEIDPKQVASLLENTKGVLLKDNPQQNEYPLPITAAGNYDVEVGRIRQSLVFGKKGLEFFVCGDQLLKGAALNAVQIAELVLKR